MIGRQNAALKTDREVPLRTIFGTALIACAALLGQGAVEAAEPPPVSAFFKRPSVRAPKLSPSGRYLAIQAAGRNDRMWLAVLDLQDMKAPKFVAGFNDADIANHHWVNEERLVFDVSDSPDGSTRVVAQGLWAVDRDGSGYRQLINSDKSFVGTATHINSRRLDINWKLHSVPPTLDGNDVIVLRRPWADDSESMGVQLARLDTRTGQTRTISQGIPDYTRRWLLDWRGEPYLVETEHQGRVRSYRRDDDGRWKPWIEDDPQARKHPVPTWIGPDNLMLGEQGYGGFSAVFKLDPQTGRSDGRPLVSTPGYDFEGRFITEPGSGRLLAVRYETDAQGTVWLDAGMKAIQADIDTRLPGSVNLIECLRCVGASHLVVTSLSDVRPPLYHLYKPADKALQPLAGTRPDLPTAAMGQRDYHRVKMRDGLEIPVLVTQPAGGVKRATPTVVLVHGGPWVRGTHWAWERDAQFLASRGYLVLEPEFRGSTGYGWRHFRAGWKQWGLAMQDDLADTLAWAAKQRWADPQRACIAGASYGGYAALMGAVTQADLFKCAISWLGVTDIGLMSSIHWSDSSDEWKQHGMKRLIADPVADAEQIRKTSPLQRAGEVRLPLLVAYGGEDLRVPLKHGTDFKAALRADQPIEWVVYGEEGHGWFNLKTNEDFWGRVERFLAKHLAPAN
jgi:dipeptidyl aminopeptidase/acylaminoacyl peptidase